MIEKLKKENIKEAAKIYNKGLKMEIPPGYLTLDQIIEKLKTRGVFVYKDNNKIKGLISFTLKNKDKIKIDFICAIEPKRGIGKKLMRKLVDFSLKNKVKIIYTSISSKDKRAMEFYRSCGFTKLGSYKSYQNLTLYQIKAKPELIKKLNKK